MKIVGIVAEFNPFHNGHEYLITQAKKISGADYIVVVMSGNYVQRGVPAIYEKHLRCQMLHGVDLVLELPVRYATSSAETFAYSAISMLEQMGCVDAICFGSESGDLTLLSKIADVLSQEPDDYVISLQKFLKAGYNFPLARKEALKSLNMDFSGQLDILDMPNNILAIEYLKALSRLNSSMKPLTIKRQGSYHETNIEATEEYASARAIRHRIFHAQDISSYLPLSANQVFHNPTIPFVPINEQDFSLMLALRLLELQKECQNTSRLPLYYQVRGDLMSRILNHSQEYRNYSDFISCLDTRNETRANISRSLLHILLHITSDKEDNGIEPAYLRILALKKDSQSLFKNIKSHSSLPLLSKPADYKRILDNKGIRLFEETLYADSLYQYVIQNKSNQHMKNDLEFPMVVLN